jgi:signal transduction histidine kinase
MIKNLNYFEKAVSSAIITPVIIIFLITTVIFYIIYSKSNAKQESDNLKQIYATNKIFQSNLSEKLSIIASSTTFIDFITSGDYTRRALTPRFLEELSTLQSNSVIGFSIVGLDRNFSFKYGNISNEKLILNLCYLANRLDNLNGNCNYRLQLYFSLRNIVSNLMKINSTIVPCSDCNKINIVDSSAKFGSFNIYDSKPLYIGVKIKDKDDSIFYYYIFVIVILFGFTIFNKLKIRRLISIAISYPLDRLVKDIEKNSELKSNNDYLYEIKYLIQKIEAWKDQLSKMQEQEKHVAIGKLAVQVAHDIRSPLTAVNMILKNLQSVTENERNIIRNTIQRIHDIANNLLLNYKENKVGDIRNYEVNIQPENIAELLDSIVSEKRLQYAFSQVVFQLKIEENTYTEFARVDSIAFKRLLSNLVNNAIEATSSNAKVILQLYKKNDSLQISIGDNGRGMSPEVILKSIEGGYSNKENGSGLGLVYAIKSIKDWGGDCVINSNVSEGTKIEIILPLVEPPDWFCQKICLYQDSNVVILDDDDSIHEVWENYFRGEISLIDNIRIYKFKNITDFNNYYATNSDITTYLVDYELLGCQLTGIEAIKKFNIADSSILVTGRHEDAEVRRQCKKIDIRIIPKSIASYIPVKIIDNNPDLIFIDDNSAITDVWKYRGEKVGKRVATFNRIQDFDIIMHRYKTEIPIYIDSNLQGKIKGEEYAKVLFEKGYVNLYLSTGYDKHLFSDFYWIKAIVGKEAPF